MLDAQRIVIRIKKDKDGRIALSCIRADGTTTWQRQQGAVAAFFPKHDLTHLAVETVLSLRQGFYGLVSAGWDFSDFGTPWPRGRPPLDAVISEIIVGFFDVERRSGELGVAAELNRRLAELYADSGLPAHREFTEDDLARVREKRAELFGRWDSIEPGKALELSFELALEESQRLRAGSHERGVRAKKA